MESETNKEKDEYYKQVLDKWIEYKKEKPPIGQLVIIYRDIESKQVYTTLWSEEDERYADMNDITHWMSINYPTN